MPPHASARLNNGDTGILDSYHPAVKQSFETMLLKYSSNHTSMREAFFDSLTNSVLVLIRAKSNCKLNPKINYNKLIADISGSYLEPFKEVILKNYEGVTAPAERFSAQYFSLVKKYLGHIAFIVSKTLANGIEDLQRCMKAVFNSGLGHIVLASYPGPDSWFKAFIWTPVLEGYSMHQEDYNNSRKQASLVNNTTNIKAKNQVGSINKRTEDNVEKNIEE